MPPASCFAQGDLNFFFFFSFEWRRLLSFRSVACSLSPSLLRPLPSPALSSSNSLPRVARLLLLLLLPPALLLLIPPMPRRSISLFVFVFFFLCLPLSTGAPSPVRCGARLGCIDLSSDPLSPPNDKQASDPRALAEVLHTCLVVRHVYMSVSIRVWLSLCILMYDLQTKVVEQKCRISFS